MFQITSLTTTMLIERRLALEIVSVEGLKIYSRAAYEDVLKNVHLLRRTHNRIDVPRVCKRLETNGDGVKSQKSHVEK